MITDAQTSHMATSLREWGGELIGSDNPKSVTVNGTNERVGEHLRMCRGPVVSLSGPTAGTTTSEVVVTRLGGSVSDNREGLAKQTGRLNGNGSGEAGNPGYAAGEFSVS